MEQLIGQTLNRYKIISLLGEGGMGAVFRAHDITLQRDVAIKVMHSHFAGSTTFQDRFLQEARSAARLDHPGIVQVYDFGQDRSSLYIVMKYIPGDNLEKLLRDLRLKDQWILLGESCSLVEQAAAALHYAHRQGVLHRDIKPGNIMIEPEFSERLPYRPVITDLGLAKLAEGGVATQDGSSMGTPAYMSPEQAQGKLTDARSDVYSLGIFLFELATGRLPFEAKNMAEAVHFHVNAAPPRPGEIRVDLPAELEDIILRCLEKEPKNRYASAADLASALKSSLATCQAIQTAPQPFSSAVSLLPQYQESVAAQNSADQTGTEEVPFDRSLLQIQVAAEDGTVHFEPIQQTITMIGRDTDNQVVISDRKASRHHARIENTGDHYRVVDLNSTNGTFLGNRRLQPGVSELWALDEEMRIGDTWFRLLIPDQKDPSSGDIGWFEDTSGAVPIPEISGPGARRISLQLGRSEITVQPGMEETVDFTIQNQGESVDIFNIFLVGIDPGWYSIPVRSFNIVPGEQKKLQIRFHPPRNSTALAGKYPIHLRIASQYNPAEYLETNLNLVVPAFHAFGSSMTPSQLTSGSNGQISIHNQGNTPESYSVRWQDPSQRLSFIPSEPFFNVAAGEEIIAEFRLENRKKPVFGPKTTQPFRAEILAGSGGMQTHQAEAITESILPTWLIPAAGFLMIAAIMLAISVFNPFGVKNNDPALTRQAADTQVAIVVKQTQEAATAFVTSTPDLFSATAAAATGTANWLVGDNDQDRLINQDEVVYKTSPENPDTDEDRLNDYEEIFQHKTDPLKTDTDGDGLRDGAEIEQGLNPLRSDTDEDGIPDGEDPAPLRKPSPTIDVPATQTAALKATERKSASQTAAVQKETAEAAAQLTTAAIKTAKAIDSATRTAQAMPRLVYIYSNDEDAANDFKSFLQSKNYRVDLLLQEQVQEADFAPYDLILIGYETGLGPDWGDEPGIIAGMLQSTGRPILGFGEGGYAFFGKIDLEIGWKNGVYGVEKNVHVVRTGTSYWRKPIPIRLPSNGITSLYNDPEEFVAVNFPNSVDDVELIANVPAERDYYPLVRQSKRYFLWGFAGTPSAMSTKGTQLLINIIEALIP